MSRFKTPKFKVGQHVTFKMGDDWFYGDIKNVKPNLEDYEIVGDLKFATEEELPYIINEANIINPKSLGAFPPEKIWESIYDRYNSSLFDTSNYAMAADEDESWEEKARKDFEYKTHEDIRKDIIHFRNSQWDKKRECLPLEDYDISEKLNNSEMKKEDENNGNHYKHLKYDPYTIAIGNDLDAYQFNAIKYIIRHPFKNGVNDIEKAIKTLEKYKESLSSRYRIINNTTKEFYD